MAKKKDNDTNFNELAELTGGEVLNNINNVKYFIDTGSFALNWCCSGKFMHGGVPGCKIIEFFGPSSSGKSYWATNVLKGTQNIDGIPCYLDCENAISPEFAVTASHLDISRIVRYAPETLERAFAKVYAVITKVRAKYGLSKPLVFVYDSLSASPCERELRETQLPENYKPADWKKIVGAKEQPGERAKVCSREFRKLETLLEKMNATMVVINQIRMKIGAYGCDPTTTAGGLALEFYAGCRVRTQPSKRIESKSGAVIGVKLKAKNVKNRSCAPFKQTEGIHLYFDKGINPISGLLSVFLQENRIIKTGKGRYKVAEKYAGGKEVSFSANKDANMVPLEVLLEAPAIVDAESREELESYLLPFVDSIHQSVSGEEVEKEIEDEEGGGLGLMGGMPSSSEEENDEEENEEENDD